jgi:hypothetical protein
MKHCLFVFALFFIFPKTSFAQMAVIDAGLMSSVTSQTGIQTSAFAKELAESIKQTKNLMDTVKNLEEQKEAMTGNLNLNSVLENSFNALLSNYENLNDPLPSQRVGGILLNTNSARDVEKLLTEKVYSTRDDPRQDIYEPLMEKYHADSSQAALQLSQTVISQAKENIERIQDTARRADGNQDLKEAVDVTNSLLVQLAMMQQEANQLLAQFIRSQTSKDFRGTVANAEKRDKSSVERIKGSSTNDINEVFKIKGKDMPFKRPGVSTVDKLFGTRH